MMFVQWQQESAAHQQSLYRNLGDRQWDLIPREDEQTLLEKLSLGLFARSYINCTGNQRQHIEASQEKVLELSGSGAVHLGFVYVNVRLYKSQVEDGIVPLIRTKKTYGNDVFFIENQPGRVYSSWTDFLHRNKLPKCDMCYPQNGFYEGFDESYVRIEFSKSPACSTTFQIMDYGSTMGKAASTVVLTAALLFPASMPLVVGAGMVLGTTTVYSLSRTIVQLVDKGSHHEPISPMDCDARSLWMNIVTDLTSSVMVGGATVLPRLVASGRIGSSVATSMLEILSWTSVGVNSFGLLINITVLVLKYLNQSLERCDIDLFIQCCQFVCNIRLSVAIAECIIDELARRPSQINRFFNMTANTTYSLVKSVVTCASIDQALTFITGGLVQSLLSYFDMPHTVEALRSVSNLWRKLRQGTINVLEMCMNLYRLMDRHLWQVCVEVAEAWKKIRRFFIFIQNRATRLLFEHYQIDALDVHNAVNRLLDNVDVPHNEMRDNQFARLLQMASQRVANANVGSEQQFAHVCRLLMNDLASRYERRLVLHVANGGYMFVPAVERRHIFNEIVDEVDTEIEMQVNHLAHQMEDTLPQPELASLGLRPWYRIENVEAYAFEVDHEFWALNQFVHDVACYLFEVDELFEHTTIHMGNENVIVMENGCKMLALVYRRQTNSDLNIGIALLI